MGYKVSSLEEMGEGYGFRKVRAALGVTAFGVNALLVPPGGEGIHHYHEVQDELYFVHRGTARFRVGDDEVTVGEGGLVHVESTTPRLLANAGEDDLVLLIVGGQGGYVERDGQLVDPADLERRQALARGEFVPRPSEERR